MTTQGPTERAARPYGPGDREAASTFLGDARPLDAAGNHTLLLEQAGTIHGVAVWLEPPPGLEEAYLGPVIVPGIRLGLAFNELVLACADDALSRGYERAYFTIKDTGLLRELKLMFRIDPVAVGWDTEGGLAREWEVHVELRDAIEQLRGVMAQQGGSGR